MDYSTAMFDGAGYWSRKNMTLPGHLRLDAHRDGIGAGNFRGKHSSGRRLHLQRSVSRRDASAGRFCFQTDLQTSSPRFEEGCGRGVIAPAGYSGSPPPQPSPIEGRGRRRPHRLGLCGVPSHRCRRSRAGVERLGLWTEIDQEGLRIPPLKLYERGARNETLFALIETNVRVPIKVFGDLRAQLAALPYRRGGAVRPRQRAGGNAKLR